jgi:hypothetical protein
MPGASGSPFSVTGMVMGAQYTSCPAATACWRSSGNMPAVAPSWLTVVGMKSPSPAVMGTSMAWRGAFVLLPTSALTESNTSRLVVSRSVAEESRKTAFVEVRAERASALNWSKRSS